MTAPINNLPAEILTRIFALAKPCALHYSASHSDPGQFSITDIASVCSYWRKVALGAPLLWCHVDLSVGKDHDANLALYARQALGRAGNLPLHVHLGGSGEHLENYRLPAQLLFPFAHRIISLDLELDVKIAQIILRDIFPPGYGSSIQELYVCDKDREGPENSGSGFNFLGGERISSDILLPLSTLHLRGLLFKASSPALKGLTELVLNPCTAHTQWAYSELRSVLFSCLKLRSLALIRLRLIADNYHAQTIDLSELEVLDLRGNKFEDVLHILSWIDSQSNALSLSLSIGNDQPVTELYKLRHFTGRSHVARFCLHMNSGIDLDLGTLSLVLRELLPLVEALAFQESAVIHRTKGPPPLPTEHFPCLHTLHLVECNLTPNGLLHLLLSFSVQKIQIMSTRAENLAEVRRLWADCKIAPAVSFVQCTPIAEGRPLLEWPLDTYP
ncbi:hypothetical protein BDV93DRAFT_551536 [Ceratobasidium sp. AG-I]|nr:hypothetical protein BDV93DRAFT_551536 [Ceratobasidium sp. AG-I]